MESNIYKTIRILNLWKLYSDNEMFKDLLEYIIFTYKKILYENRYIRKKLLLNNINSYVKKYKIDNEEINFVINYVMEYNTIIEEYIYLECL